MGLTFSREELTTEFPVELGSAKVLGIFEASFTAMAWVYSNVFVSDTGGYPIFGTREHKYRTNKGLHLQVCLCTTRT